MEQNIYDTLGVNNKEGLNPSIKENGDDNSAERTLSTIADIILVVGILGALGCFFSLAIVTDKYDEVDFSFAGFGISICVLFSTLISWSLTKVIANISLTLKEIKNK